jgi:hypothetical protein
MYAGKSHQIEKGHISGPIDKAEKMGEELALKLKGKAENKENKW